MSLGAKVLRTREFGIFDALTVVPTGRVTTNIATGFGANADDALRIGIAVENQAEILIHAIDDSSQ